VEHSKIARTHKLTSGSSNIIGTLPWAWESAPIILFMAWLAGACRSLTLSSSASPALIFSWRHQWGRQERKRGPRIGIGDEACGQLSSSYALFGLLRSRWCRVAADVRYLIINAYGEKAVVVGGGCWLCVG
jgi:hypothetical protein